MFALLKRYRELILVAVLLVVPLGVFFAHAKAPGERSKLDRAVVWLATPLERAIGWTLTGVMNGWNGYVALRGAQARAGRLAEDVRTRSSSSSARRCAPRSAT